MSEETATDINTEEELKARLAALGKISDEQRNSVVCALIGHSRISTFFWGYRYCARCGEQVGDNLASIDLGSTAAVIVGHDCQLCRENAKTLTWRDTVFSPDPFPPKPEATPE